MFVGDLAGEVTDIVLQESFRAYYSSVRSAKVTFFVSRALLVATAISVALQGMTFNILRLSVGWVMSIEILRLFPFH